MKRIATIIILLVGFVGMTKAQGDYEALLFSQSDYYGTARFMGAGGAFGSTGGDFSAVITNPASIGLYKRSEVTITPVSLMFSRTNTLYEGNVMLAKNNKYTFPQCGIVISNNINRGNEWRSWQFGYGYNRVMDYNGTYRMGGVANNTLMDMVVANVNGTMPGSLSGDGNLAWNSWLIDTIQGTYDQYYSPYSGSELEKMALVKRKGSIDEMTFTFGGNYGDKLYVGATIGVPFLDFREVTTYSEEPNDATDIFGIKKYVMTSEQINKSTGINLKLGIIYQPVEFMRLGVGFHTPTYYWKVRDNFTRSLETSYTSGVVNTDSYTNYNKFSLSTPLKFNVSASFIIKKRAFIAAEYEFVNYGMANLYSDSYDYIDENQIISEKFGASHNIRVGGEINLTQGFALRAGYRLKTSPYKNVNSEFDNTTHFISAGLGFKGRHFFGDLAYVYRMNKDSYWVYDPVGTPALTTTKAHGAVLTLGYKF